LRENPAVAAFLLALTTVTGRMTASQVLDLLQMDPVCARFGIEALGLERIREWVEQSGIRWGVDARHHAEYGLPEDDLNSWEHGIRRLLLGYAAPDDGGTLFRGVAPVDDVAASEAGILDGLLAFTE